MGVGGPPRGAWRLALCAALLGWALASPARAQESDSAETQALVHEPMSIYAVRDMDFGQIAAGASAGTVTLTASPSATCSTTGPIVRSGVCSAARFGGYGNPWSFVRVARPPGDVLTLTGPGGATMQVTDFTYSGDSTMLQVFSNATYVRFLVITGDGLFEMSVGGTLHVGANQAPGKYTGTIEVLLNYN